MRVLVLSWDVRARDGGPTPQAAGLATALARAGDEVRVVTRGGDGGAAPELAGVEVHAVADAPPIIPAQLDEPLLASEAFAATAMAVVVRRLREQPADVVHAAGWQAGPVVAGLRSTHDVPVVGALGAGDLDIDRWGELAAATAGRLARDANLVLATTDHDADVIGDVTSRPVEVVRPGVDLPERSPGPPPARGPLHLVAPPGQDHRAVARSIRAAARGRRRITGSWRRRPFAVAVLDPGDVTAAVRALAWGVPLLATDGPVGELATSTGGGLVVEPTGTAVAAALDQLAADAELAAVLGATGAAAALPHAWPAVAAAWRRTVAAVVGGPATRLHATG